jgi:hypothetical protein
VVLYFLDVAPQRGARIIWTAVPRERVGEARVGQSRKTSARVISVTLQLPSPDRLAVCPLRRERGGAIINRAYTRAYCAGFSLTIPAMIADHRGLCALCRICRARTRVSGDVRVGFTDLLNA